MTISTTTSAISYTGTGTIATYSYTWQIAQAADLVVYTLTGGTTLVALALTSGFTVAGVANPTGGTITLAAGNLPAGVQLFIASDPLEVQLLLLSQGAAFNPADLMNALDSLTRQIQATRRVATNAVQIPLVESLAGLTTILPPAAVRANGTMMLDGSGNVIVSTPSSTSIPISGLGQVVDTVALMRTAIAPVGSATLIVRGYYAAGDMAPRIYWWNAADTTTDNGGTVIKITATTTGRWNLLFSGAVSVKWFGATGNGVTDDTTAINAANTYTVAQSLTLYFPAGNYVYNGTGLSGSQLQIVGDGKRVTTITLGASSYFVNSPVLWYNLLVQGFSFSGGIGVVRNTYNGGVDVQDAFIVRDCRFNIYTSCAVGALQTNGMPYWHFDNCQFFGNDDTTCIGVAIPKLSDMSSFSNCSFLKNNVHAKLASGGNNVKFYNCDFIRWDAYTTAPRISIWTVPNADSGILQDGAGGDGFAVTACKFGDENLDYRDHHVVYADEAAGTDFTTKLPNLTTASTGYIVGHVFRDCHWQGVFASAGDTGQDFVFSTTPHLYSCRFTGDIDVPQQYFIFFLASILPLASNVYSNDNSFDFWGISVNIDQSENSGALKNTQMAISNAVGIGHVIDPLARFWDVPRALAYRGGSDPAGYLNLLTASITAFTTSSATIAAITDDLGGQDAAQVTIGTAGGYVYNRLLTTSIIIGQQAWIEFSFKADASTPINGFYAIINDEGNPNTLRRFIAVAAGGPWQKVRIPWMPRKATGNFDIMFAPAINATGSNVDIARVRVYQASEPQNIDAAFPGGGKAKSKSYTLTGINVNATNTDAGTFIGLPAKYRVTHLIAFDASTSLTTATTSLYTATGGGGTALVSAQALSPCTSATKYADLTLATAATTDYQTAASLVLRDITAQGAAATCSFRLVVEDLTT